MSHSKCVQGLGNAWLYLAKRILAEGIRIEVKSECYVELKGIVLGIENPTLPDMIIDQYADVQWLDWMKNNFNQQGFVPELGDARSYASRLYSYAGGKDQVAWVIQKLRQNPKTRSATITMLEPMTDEIYVPCVSLLDFDLSGGSLELYVYCRSLDFGKKAYGNLVCLAEIQGKVAAALQCQIGRLFLIVKSAHIYEEDMSHMQALTRTADRDQGNDAC